MLKLCAPNFKKKKSLFLKQTEFPPSAFDILRFDILRFSVPRPLRLTQNLTACYGHILDDVHVLTEVVTEKDTDRPRVKLQLNEGIWNGFHFL